MAWNQSCKHPAISTLRVFAALGAGALAFLGGCLDNRSPTAPGEKPLAVSLATLQTNFTENTVASGLDRPTAFTIHPDGRIFICQQGGKLRVVKNGSLLSTPFVSLSVNSSGERGLLGVAVDPSFSANHFIYVYYTTSSSPIHNRVSRFTANGDVAVSGSETQILNLPALGASNHNGGAMNFGPDGKLYIAVGENAVGANAQSMSTVLGKMLRINKDGTIPTDNPFFNSTSGNNRAIWALGLRNPFTFSFQAGTGRMFINDVGQDTWEEINDGIKGANYGWNASEGPDRLTGAFKAPFHYYANNSGNCAIVGSAFYNPATKAFPTDYQGDYFFGDFCGDYIKRIDLTTKAVTTFATGIPDLVDIEVHNDGSLYYLARNGNSTAGFLRRVRFTGATPPVITTQPQGQTVAVGQTATFTVEASGGSLAFQWQRNGINISGATASTLTRANAQLSDSGAAFRCVVSNASGSVTSAAATLTVIDDKPPTATIVNPPAGSTYQGGQTIAFSGTGTDAEDGALPASAFTWQVDFHHDDHTHPALAATSGITSGSFTVPTSGETSDNVFYQVHLTVKDSRGLTHHVTRDVLPVKSSITLATNPSGLQIILDGVSHPSPFTFTGVAGIQRSIGAPASQALNGQSMAFSSWSDGGAATHTISTPAVATTFTATYQGASLYEAENALLSGAVVANNKEGFTGTGFADYINASNDFVEWTVSTTTAGAHPLDIRYALSSTTARSLRISVNGATVNDALAFPPTGSWTTWQVITQNATLAAGTNKIRATAIGTSGPNVDNLTVR